MSVKNPNQYSEIFKPKYLQSEIIHQKKQLIFKVEQTTNHVFPNENYKYYIYLKNISGVPINNIHIKVNTPSEILLNEEDNGKGVLTIDTLKNDEVKLIYLQAKSGNTGEHFVHFLCYGDETGLQYQTLKINCSYNNISDELIHRIHFYDFAPYEDIFYTKADNYSNQVTQLFKTQKLPFQAGQQPFPMKPKDNEVSPNLFSNIESESFIEQNNLAKNSKEHVYQYLSRENFNENSIESYEGKNLQELVNNINRNSKLFKAQLLKTGNNTLKTDFQQYEPNGFIHRFGLLNSEIYHYLGTLPTYSYMSDFLFRWAPDGREPLQLYPQKIAMHWNEKKWSGRGWVVYRIATEEFINSKEFTQTTNNRWDIIGHFNDITTAESCVERQQHFDDIIMAQRKSDLIKYIYEIRESYYDRGVFYIHIPINKVPSNFYLLDTTNLEAIIQRAKPFGTKALIRYLVEDEFNDNIEFVHQPIYRLYSDIEMGDFEIANHLIQTKKENLITETICNEEIQRYQLVPDGLTTLYNSPYNHDVNIITEPFKPTIYDSRKENSIPDNSINHDITQYININSSVVDNSLKTLREINQLLYQSGFSNIAFSIPSNIVDIIKIQQNDIEYSEQSIIQNWMKKNNYKSFSYPIENKSDNYYFVGRNKQCDSFKIPIIQRNLINTGKNDIGIGFIDIHNKYHLFSLKYDTVYKKDYITYSTVFNNNFKTKKDGLGQTSSLVFKIVKINDDYKNNLIIFFLENQGQLHYFHHIISSDLKEVFVFASDSITHVIENNEERELNIGEYMKYSSNNKDKVTFETPQYDEIDYYETTNLLYGENWTNLYRINKAENSYTYIQNTSNEVIDVDDIALHFDNINIPEKAEIKDIRLKTILSSSHRKTVFCDTSYQSSYLIDNVDGLELKLFYNNLECYPQTKESQYYYYEKLNNIQTQGQEDYYIDLINENILFDESIDFDDEMIIKNPYWIELSEFTTTPFDCNDIERIEFVLEGYNNGPEVNIISQLLCKTDIASDTQMKIPTGYFYQKIDIPFLNSFLMDLVRLRFRFEDLNDSINIFDGYINIKFKNKQPNEILYYNTDDIVNIDKNIYYINGLIDEQITAEELNNGITFLLSFDSLNPGEYYRIYSTELEIVYQEKEISLLINKHKFSSDSFDDRYIVVSGKTNDAYLSGEFYNDADYISQEHFEMNMDNIGIELKDTLYQAFYNINDNITSIEIFPNGFRGNPDSILKLGVYENHGFSPGKLIKEVYVNGWTKSNSKLKKLNSIKYEINIDGLEKNQLYWFKLGVENPSDNNYYLLKYTTNRWEDYKLLLKENNNYINTSGSLKFNIYSKNLSTSFNQLPAVQDYLTDCYVKIGLHKGQGTITNLSVKRMQEEIFNGNF